MHECFLFGIDDRVDVALAIDAEGVHVGQSDMPVHIARKLMGEDKIVGATVGTPIILTEKQYTTEARVTELCEDFVTSNNYVTKESIPGLVDAYLNEMLEGEY